jgi:hypothetical protein
MRTIRLPHGFSPRLVAAFLAGVLVTLSWVGGEGRLAAGPINPKVFKTKFDKAAKDADLVATVRVLAAVCTGKTGAAKGGAVNLELALQVLKVQRGKAKENEVLVIAHKITLPAGPGPRSYGYWAALRQFPCTPGVHGDVALRWDKEARRYAVVAGWVESPNNNPAALPTAVGKAYVAGDGPAPK